MTDIDKKREEIREGIEKAIALNEEVDGVNAVMATRDVLAYLHSQGVVIVVDDHLSELDAMEIGVAVEPLVKT